MQHAKTANRAQPATLVTAPAGVSSRTAPCPCGSSQRYKHCCGKVSDASPATVAAASSMQLKFDDAIVRRAGGLLSSGEATRAAELLAHLRPTEINDALIALEARHL